MADFDRAEPNRDRIEELLRRSLQSRAQDVQPDPRTWQTISARVRRQRVMRWSLAGAGALGALVVAAVVLPTLLNPSAVDLDFADPDDIEVFETPEGFTDPAPGPGGAPCGGPEHVAAVLARSGQELEGTLWALCDDGSETLLVESGPGLPRINPSFAPDGRAVVFETRTIEAEPVLVHLDLTSGDQQVLGGGRLPAFAPDGRLAWVQPMDGTHDLILIGEPFSEPEMEFPVMEGTDGETFEARRLAWDATGETLYAEIGYEESVVYAYDPQTGAGRRLEEPVGEERYGAPSTAPEGLGVAVLARCCFAMDGEAFTSADLRLVDSDDGRLVTQAPEGFDTAGDVWTSFVRLGDVDASGDPVRWTGGSRAAWLIGDGDGVWLVLGDGTAHLVTEKVSAAAANPALGADGPGEPAGIAPEQQGLPHDVGVTRQRIWQAAQARDHEALGALMGPEFTASFGADGGREAGVARLRAMEEQGEDPFALILQLLEMPYATQEREGGPSPIVTWPAVFATPADQWTAEDEAQLRQLGDEQDIESWRRFGSYIGWRLGIDASGTWLYFTAAD